MRAPYFSILLLICINFAILPLIAKGRHHNPDSSAVATFFGNCTYQFSFMNAAIGMPPHFINGRLQPGFEIGISRELTPKPRKSKMRAQLFSGYFAHKSLQRIGYLKPGLGYRFDVGKHLKIQPMINISCMWTRQINDEFRYTGNGTYEKVSRTRIQLMPAAGLEAETPFISKSKFSSAFFLRYELGMQWPFSEISRLLPVGQIHLGFKIKRK